MFFMKKLFILSVLAFFVSFFLLLQNVAFSQIQVGSHADSSYTPVNSLRVAGSLPDFTTIDMEASIGIKKIKNLYIGLSYYSSSWGNLDYTTGIDSQSWGLYPFLEYRIPIKPLGEKTSIWANGGPNYSQLKTRHANGTAYDQETTSSSTAFLYEIGIDLYPIKGFNVGVTFYSPQLNGAFIGVVAHM